MLYFEMLYYAKLHYAMLHYTTLCYTTLYYTTLCCNILHYAMLHYTAMQYYTTLYYTMLCYTTLHYSVLNYTTLCFTILQYTVLYYTTLHYAIPHSLHMSTVESFSTVDMRTSWSAFVVSSFSFAVDKCQSGWYSRHNITELTRTSARLTFAGACSLLSSRWKKLYPDLPRWNLASRGSVIHIAR